MSPGLSLISKRDRSGHRGRSLGRRSGTGFLSFGVMDELFGVARYHHPAEGYKAMILVTCFGDSTWVSPSVYL